jgi:hypothetical protein
MTIYEILRRLKLSPKVWHVLTREDDSDDMDDMDYDYPNFESDIEEESPYTRSEMSYIAPSPQGFGTFDAYEACCFRDIVTENMDEYALEKITWLSERADTLPGDKKGLAAAALVCGNEPSIWTFYSTAVILAKVPPAGKRTV